VDPAKPFGGYQPSVLLGQGGFAEVWEAERLSDGRRVALKVLRHSQGPAEESRRRFEREGRVAASLSHPRTVYVFSADTIEGHPVIAMELMEGGTLQDRLERAGPMQPRDAVDALLDVIDGLEAAERLGIVHRDIKPSNCFMDRSGRVKIGDFGIARSPKFSPDQTATGIFVGTPAFASPEHLRGQPANNRSDLYSVGATLYALLTGHPPFKTTVGLEMLANVMTQPPVPLSEHGVRVPRALRRVVMRLLAKDPSKRHRSYAALRSSLTPFSSRDALTPDPVRRFGAYLVDLTLSTALVSAVLAGISRVDLLEWIQRPTMEPHLVAAGGLAIQVFCFSLLEWLWQRTPGKQLFGLYVGTTGGSPLSPGQAMLRNLSFWTLHNALGWVGLLAPDWIAPLSLLGAVLPCSSMRTTNGFAGLHEILTGTRVLAVRKQSKVLSRAVRGDDITDAAGVAGERAAYRGPYRLVSEIWRTDRAEWSIAFDELLSRRVWIHQSTHPDNAASVDALASFRPARLHWLQGGMVDGRRWNAYEAPSGVTLVQHVRSRGRLGWPETLEILLELLPEVGESLVAGDLPEPFTLEHLWIDAHGHLTVLECPAQTESTTGAKGFETISGWPDVLKMATLLCLEGVDTDSVRSMAAPPRVPLPGRARAFLDRLFRDPLNESQLPDLIAELRELSRSPASVSRSVRVTQLLCAWSLPGIVVIGAFVGSLESLRARTPRGAELANMAHSVAASLDFAMVVLGIFAIPSLLAAYLYRGGPLLRLFGLRVQRLSGEPASRLRCLYRASVAMAPPLLIGAPVWILGVSGFWAGLSSGVANQSRLTMAIQETASRVGKVLALGISDLPPVLRVVALVVGSCLAVMFLAGVLLTMLHPERTIQDRLAGTMVMPN
jgi:uncharacterized RDD family membrane protein YckC/tRNA A-37 threonylcarbamoyl transferase component Bud32